MQLLRTFDPQDRERWLRVLSAAAGIRSHRELHGWLAGADMQALLPHDIVIMACGDIRGGACAFDVVASQADIRTVTADADQLRSRIQQLFAQWWAQPQAQPQPHAVDADVLHGVFAGMSWTRRSALVHGLHDRRAGQDSCYIVVSSQSGHHDRSAAILANLLPYIDIGFRQVAMLAPRPARAMPSYHESPSSRHGMPAEQITFPDAAAMLNTMGMTDRELQIMRWVEVGKTNHEIGAILHISEFTVKNHLQRIFKKLDVYSRAQAVSRFKDSMLYG